MVENHDISADLWLRPMLTSADEGWQFPDLTNVTSVRCLFGLKYDYQSIPF